MEGMLVPSKVLLRVLIRSRSFCTARGEKSQCLSVASLYCVSQNKAWEVRRDVSKRPENAEKCDQRHFSFCVTFKDRARLVTWAQKILPVGISWWHAYEKVLGQPVQACCISVRQFSKLLELIRPWGNWRKSIYRTWDWLSQREECIHYQRYKSSWNLHFLILPSPEQKWKGNSV